MNANGNRDEARRAKDSAEAKFAEENYTLAKKLAQRAQSMCPEIDGISQFLDVVDVFIRYEMKVGALTDWYNVLGVSPTCGEEIIRRQYRKMALSLHPDKNQSIGSTDAFTIIAEAFDVLSDQKKRSEYDSKRHLNLQREKHYWGDLSSTTCTKAPNHHHDEAPRSTTNKRPSAYPMMPPSHTNTGSFWTICTTCMTYHFYGEIFHGKKLMCASCLNTFSADKVPCPPGEATETSTASNETALKRTASKEQTEAPTCAKPPHINNVNSNHQSSSSYGNPTFQFEEAPNCNNPTGFGRFRSRWEARKHEPFHHQQGPTASHENPNPTGLGQFRSRWEARKAATSHHQHDGPSASHENPNPTGFGQFRSRWEARKAAPSYHQQGFPSSYYRQQPNIADSHHRNSFFPGDGQVSSSSIQPSFSGTPTFCNFYAGQRANSRQQMNMWSLSAGSGFYWSGFHMNLHPNINLDLGSDDQHAQIRTEDMRQSRQVNDNMIKRPLFYAEQPEEEGGNDNKRSNAGTKRCNISGNKFSNFNNDNGNDPGSGSSTNIGDSLNRRMNHSWKFWCSS